MIPTTMKPSPYLRSCRTVNEYRTAKPRFRLVKIDTEGRRRSITIPLVNDSSLEDAKRAFLSPPPCSKANTTTSQATE